MANNSPTDTIETTLGELICAITEAARESTVEETELNRVTQLVLEELLQLRKNRGPEFSNQ